ncbi:hypothetical protein [Clostridium pasteurianum]|uniref:Uncharacterized protein n=1 Tax=Clostridium pasteurianum BC1 TaxID=86416 RepID=R4KCB1_CLOPA|nr:hypothetical protein [Clostridium pasteurianum]AGK98164.1 hypothetical protein Clopa_3368 [Clostridium pasteurianum BC1]
MAFKNKEKYYIEMTKLVKVMRWTISALNNINLDDLPSIEDFIGEYPTYGEKETIKEETPIEDKQEPSESEKEWVEWAKKNGLSVAKTSTGVKIRK